jgi:AraC-like DNA-binding protein
MPSISENILLFVSGAGTLQGLLLALLIYFHPKSEKSVGVFLAVFIGCISIQMLLPLAQFFFPWQRIIFLAPSFLLQGPLLYLYVRSFKEVITWKKALPHFIFFFAYFFVACGVGLVLGGNYPLAKNMPPEVVRNPYVITASVVRLLQMLTYYFLAYRTLHSYNRSINQLFSETSKIDLAWVKWLLNGYLFLVFTIMGLYFILLKFPQYFSLFLLLNAAISTVYIYISTFKGISQPTIWQLQKTNKEEVEKEIIEAEKIEEEIIEQEKPKSAKTGLAKNKIDDIIKKITSLMLHEKVYTETELTLQQLANRLQFPTYQVSQAINEGMEKNFYDLVNGYRVEEAKRLLLDPKNANYTILSIGFEAGFNSKTTFNTVFKKFTGLTPTEFREKRKMAYMVA